MKLAAALIVASAAFGQTEFDGDPALKMVEAIHSYLDRATQDAIAHPAKPDRTRLARLVGAVDPRVPFRDLLYEGQHSAATGAGYKVHAVRWPVFSDYTAEGLLLEPDAPARARVVSMSSEAGARLAAAGCQVLIPMVMDRASTWSGIPGIRMTTQSHREWIYRMAFETGRHIIGYELETVRAAVDWFAQQEPKLRTGVAGDGDGGMIALYAAALDERIDAALVTGYSAPRAELWKEPIDHDVWRILREPDLAAYVAPRLLASSENDFARALGLRDHQAAADSDPMRAFNRTASLHRQFEQMVAHTQALIRASDRNRTEFWSKTGSPQAMRDYVWNEVIGRLPDPAVPLNPRMRQIYDEPKFRGYEVMLDVWQGVFAYGILLVPKDLKPGERRPVVVCQHGLEGRSRDVADPDIDSKYYHRYAVKLAEEGFIAYAPQNPYIGEDRFRQIQRKAHPLGLSLFSFILGQHQALLSWLGTLPYIDTARIGFYGLSYGGKTAMRVPPLLSGYALSICSADFNDWVRKVTSVDAGYSYMLTGEYDMLEWNFANVVNYSDLANLMAPRPFMVERGHDDGVAPDDWVAGEFAKVRRFYVKAGIPDRAEIEFFDGPHTINGQGTFEFLRRYLGPAR